MATALKNAINSDIALLNAGITASSLAGVLTLDVNGGVGTVLVYDANGNLINDGTNSYSWDAENRLIKITYPGTGNESQFSYDAFGRNVKIVEVTGGSTTSTKQFVWCGWGRCESRDASGNVTTQFFDYGQKNGSDVYQYAKNHLGSICEMTNNSAVVQAEYDYDPYGVKVAVSEFLPADFQYTGHYFHTRSALNLAPFRAYNARLGRWLSRDPIFETVRTNSYNYVSNNPINWVDLWGLQIGAPRVGPILPEGYDPTIGEFYYPPNLPDPIPPTPLPPAPYHPPPLPPFCPEGIFGPPPIPFFRPKLA